MRTIKEQVLDLQANVAKTLERECRQRYAREELERAGMNEHA